MRRAVAIVTVTLGIALVGVLGFGWPGEIILITLAPGLILGSIIAHVVDAWIGRCELRISFVMLGTVLGIFSTMIALLFIGAATVPSEVRIEDERWLEQPPDFVWASVGEPSRWGRWDAWLGRIELAEVEGSPDVIYHSTLVMGSTEVPAVHRVVERVEQKRFVWAIELAPGSAFTELSQELTLHPERGGTRVRYAVSYKLPSVTARALHALLFKRGLEVTAEESLEGLAKVVQARDES